MNKNVLKRTWPFLLLFLAACGNSDKETVNPAENNPAIEEITNGEVQSGIDTPLDEEVQPGTVKMVEEVKEETNPKYPVGTKVKILADRIEGMEGAEGVVVGAYDTTAYSVEYLPTTGGDKVLYKWLIEQELEGVNGAGLDEGINVIINADHIKGMQGASGEIKGSNKSTVYMVDFTTTTGEQVKNYKWVTEDELSLFE